MHELYALCSKCKSCSVCASLFLKTETKLFSCDGSWEIVRWLYKRTMKIVDPVLKPVQYWSFPRNTVLDFVPSLSRLLQGSARSGTLVKHHRFGKTDNLQVKISTSNTRLVWTCQQASFQKLHNRTQNTPYYYVHFTSVHILDREYTVRGSRVYCSKKWENWKFSRDCPPFRPIQ